jgi:PAS domain S-box-containing protein
VPVRILGTTIDVTDQRAAFDVLQQSEERFKVIANNAPVMIWMSGNERYAGFYNTSWIRFTGRSPEHEHAADWHDAVHPDDVTEYIRVYDDAFKNQETFQREYRMKRYDGQYRWISEHAVPRYDNAHNFIGFIGAARDIDDEKRFNERLQASELLFKTIANVSPVGLWMTDINGKNNFVNHTWVEWTGISIDDHYDEGWFAAVLDEDKSHVLEVCQKSFEARENFAVEFRVRRKDGQIRWMLSEGGPFYNNDKEFAGIAGSVADITERKQEEILKNDFLAVASHELKTPITSIKAYTQLLAKTYEKTDNEFLKGALVKMENQINKMTKLVSDFLNISKIESGKFQLNIESFDLSKLVTEVAGDIQLVSVNHNIVVKDTEPVFVNADRERIAQVITNYLNNAVKYSPDNKQIVVEIQRIESYVTVSVTDKGIGIRREEHNKIFERFYRAEANMNTAFSGFGIGLYICAEIIRRHGGYVGVKSEEGKGSVFYFALPGS